MRVYYCDLCEGHFSNEGDLARHQHAKHYLGTKCERCGNPLGDAWNSADHLCPPHTSHGTFVAIGQADLCDWCNAPYVQVNEDGMCKPCYLQAELDDANQRFWGGDKSDPWAEAFAAQDRIERSEIEAGTRRAEEAIRRSMDALRDSCNTPPEANKEAT